MAAAALTSCNREPAAVLPAEELGPNTLAFTLQDAPSLKSGDLISTRTLTMGKAASGETVYLQEKVTMLEGLYRVPATKAALATKENVGSLYGAFDAMIYDESGSPLEFDSKTGGPFQFAHETSHGKWAHSFGSNPLDSKSPLSFIMAMPTPEGFGLNSDGKIEFSYTTPPDVTDQVDLLIAGVELSKETYIPASGFSVTFQHALTGVKFAMGNIANGTKISAVTIKGLVSGGSAVAEADGTGAEWTPGESTADYTMEGLDSYYTDDSSVGDDLNDEAFSNTFWFVPQTLPDNAEIEVTFSIGGGEEKTLRVKLNEALGETVTWAAGELHTFTLNPMFVDVDITDEMNTAKTVKYNAAITNTGNIIQYVRVNLIGNWVGKLTQDSGFVTIMNGFPTQTGATVTDETDTEGQVLPWNDKDEPKAHEVRRYGEFVGLPAKNQTVNNWIRRDKYYYYMIAIEPGATIQDELFNSYTIEKSAIPDFWIADAWGNRKLAKEVHLEMDVIVQAVSALDENGNPYDDYKAAWQAALGPEADIDDL